MTQTQRHPMSPYPRGWYGIALSRDIERGMVVSKQFAGKEVLIYRTYNGQAVVTDAYCPHLGAHLGHYGKVESEGIRCTFHGFKFDCSGQCRQTGYNTKPPPTAKLYTYQTVESNHTIFVWHPGDHGTTTPDWEVPQLSWEGWRPLKSWHYRGLSAHAQDMTENSVDMGHFFHAHGFRDLEMLSPLDFQGPCMQLHYRFKRAENPKKNTGKVLEVEVHIKAWGIGLTVAEGYVQSVGLRNRVMVYHTPTHNGLIDVWVLTSIQSVEHKEQMHPLFKYLPTSMVDALVSNFVHRHTTNDIQGDFPYLANKRYLTRPALAEGDGPIGKFRTWVKQFYAEEQTQ